MFKKRASASLTKAKRDEDGDGATSPTITVSVPLDPYDAPNATPPHLSRKTTEDRSTQSNPRSSADHRNVRLYQPWKPWDPQKLTRDDSTKYSLNPTTARPILTTSSSSSSPHTSSTSAAVVIPGAISPTVTRSPAMMLNISSIFSGSSLKDNSVISPQANSQQPVEAQLWNADITATSPLSPAGPRYIPATAGKGARVGFGSGTSGRMGSNQTIGKRRGSNEGPHWQRFGNVSSASPSLPEMAGSWLSSSAWSIARSATISSDQHSDERSQSTSFIFPNSQRRQTPPDRQSYASSRPSQQSPPTFDMLNDVLSDRSGGNSSRISSRYQEGSRMKHNQGGAETLSSHMSIFDDRHRETDMTDWKGNHNHRSHPTDARRGGEHRTFHQTPLFANPKRALRARIFCLRQNRRLHPAIRLVMLLFLAGSVFYTTFHLIFRDSTSRQRLRKSFEYSQQQLRARRILMDSGNQKKAHSPFDVEAQNYTIHQWALDTVDIEHTRAIARVGEDYMLSKAFNAAMQPTRMLPFYFKASFRDEEDDDDNNHDEDVDGVLGPPSMGDPERSDNDKASTHYSPVLVDPSLVTVTTLITPDRYGVLLKLAKQYRGPISVAMHIKKGDDQDSTFHGLHDLFREHSILRKYVDLHVIVDDVELQLNMWRNVARMFARTEYFMMLDVDFHIPSGLKDRLHYDPHIKDLLAAGSALVIPAFEYALEHDPKDSRYFPDTKADLVPLLEKKHIRVFHDSFPPGHAATDTPRWVKMSKRAAAEAADRSDRALPKVKSGFEDVYGQGAQRSGNSLQEDDHAGSISDEEQEEYLQQEADGERPYKVTGFEPKYEPYVVLKREGTPWCDERFVGYGANKAACLFEIYISGVDFWVMPSDFLIHQYHDYPTKSRHNGRTLNKQLFVQFQQEICFATLQRMIVTGEWYTTKADNLRHQCGAFEDFMRSADQLAKAFEDQHPQSLLEEPVFVVDRDVQQSGRRAWHAQVPEAGSGLDPGEDVDSIDRYRSQGRGKVALGERIAADQAIHDPFMSKPKGKIWGGIQPRAFYKPLISISEEDGIPIEGIDLDAAVAGTPAENANDGHSDENDLTGEQLARFRQGIIVSEGYDRGFASPRAGGDEEGAESQEADRLNPEIIVQQGQKADEQDQHSATHPSRSWLSHQSSESHEGGKSFEEAAEELEDKLLAATSE